MTPSTNNGLEPFFSARSVALVGASESKDKPGNQILRNLISREFKGRIFPVNPNASAILGLKCYRNLLEIREIPDLSIIVIPAKFVTDSIEEHLKKGIKNIILLTAGFGETDENGRRVEKKISSLISDSRIRMIGPNCMGILDNISQLDTFFVPPELIKRPVLGTVSFASQSGSFAGHLMDLASSERLGMARVISYGNRIDLDEADALEFFADDEKTSIVGLYVEGVKNGKEFLEAAKYCTDRKPVLAIKTGRNETLGRAVTSHTGMLAGSYQAHRAAFKKAGIIEVKTIEQMIDAFKAFTSLSLPRGNRVLILGHAGGLGLAQADLCIENGLEVPRPDSRLSHVLRSKLLPFASIQNPIDITASGTDEDAMSVLREGLVESDFADMAIYLALWGLRHETDRIAEIIPEVMKLSAKPVIVATVPGEAALRKRTILEGVGVPVFLSLSRAADVGRLLVELGKREKYRQAAGKFPSYKEREGRCTRPLSS